jgi:hypothetical protein
LTDAQQAADWARRSMSIKNKLTFEDAKIVEAGFTQRILELEELSRVKSGKPYDQPDRDSRSAPDDAQVTVVGTFNGSKPDFNETQTTTRRPKSRKPRGISDDPAKAACQPTKSEREHLEMPSAQSSDESTSIFPIEKIRRLRDKDHLRRVAQQPCLICGRLPSDAHHLRFAQTRALGKKVSDEFTVPVCRTHHREIHSHGNERAWWHAKNLEPLAIAETLWKRSHKGSTECSPLSRSDRD